MSGETADAPPPKAVVAKGKKRKKGKASDNTDFDSYTTLPAELYGYLKEVVGNADDVEDDEEREILVDRVLEEISGKEVDVCGDSQGSRLLETLMATATPEQHLALVQAIAPVETFWNVANSPFGCHVLEKSLIALEAVLHEEKLTDECFEALDPIFQSVAGHLWDYMSHRYATHVARRLLQLAAGHDVVEEVSGRNTKGAKAGMGLASKLYAVQRGGRRRRSGLRFPPLMKRVLEAIMGEEFDPQALREARCDMYASPWLQMLLHAAAPNEAAMLRLIPHILGGAPRKAAKDGEWLAELELKDVHGMMTHRTASHVLEAVVAVAPAALFDEFHDRFLKGHLQMLAADGCANFVVQAAFVGAASAAQFGALLDELAPALPQLVQQRRSGVLACAVAGAGRTGCEEAACSSLAGALRKLGTGNAAPGHKPNSVLLPLLLGLDAVAYQGAGAGIRVTSLSRLSTVGCAMAATILRFPFAASKPFIESLALLSKDDMLHIAGDSGGCRVLEAYLQGPAGQKQKRQLIGKIKGHFGKVGCIGAGSFVVEAAFHEADTKWQENILKELLESEAALRAKPWGERVLETCGARAFKRDADAWRGRAASSAGRKDKFMDLFVEQPQAEVAHRADNDGADEVPAATPRAEASGDAAEGKKKKKKSKKSKADEAADGRGAGEKKRKKRKGGEVVDGVEEKKKSKKSVKKGADQGDLVQEEMMETVLDLLGDSQAGGASKKKKKRRKAEE